MTEAVTGYRPNLDEAARKMLQASAALWFLTAVVGQWLFVYYIAGFYGLATLSGNFEAWDRNRNLIDGYVAGDTVGNLFFGSHVLIAAVLTFGGTLQLVPQMRARAMAVHRWNGRLFLLAAIAAASAGLYLEWVRGTGLHDGEVGVLVVLGALGLSLNGLLILTFAGFAWCAVRAKKIAAHQRWATRLFLVVNGVWFLRVGFRAWMLLTAGAFGGQPFFSFWNFGSYLVPLAVYELYWRTKTAGAWLQFAMVASIVALTLIMGVGEVATFLRSWRPLLML